MYTVSEVVEIDTAQNLILEVTEKIREVSDDLYPLRENADANFDE